MFNQISLYTRTQIKHPLTCTHKCKTETYLFAFAKWVNAKEYQSSPEQCTLHSVPCLSCRWQCRWGWRATASCTGVTWSCCPWGIWALSTGETTGGARSPPCWARYAFYSTLLRWWLRGTVGLIDTSAASPHGQRGAARNSPKGQTPFPKTWTLYFC